MHSRYEEVELLNEFVHLSVVQRLVQQAVDCFGLSEDRSDGPKVAVDMQYLVNSGHFLDEAGHLMVHLCDVSADSRCCDGIGIHIRASFFESTDVDRPAHEMSVPDCDSFFGHVSVGHQELFHLAV